MGLNQLVNLIVTMVIVFLSVGSTLGSLFLMLVGVARNDMFAVVMAMGLMLISWGLLWLAKLLTEEL